MMGMAGMTDSRVPVEDLIAARTLSKHEADPHLQSNKVVEGYQIHADDGTIGNVQDFMIDDHWNIRFLVVDTGSWFPGRNVLISPRWISKVAWEDSSVYVALSKEAVKNSPEYHSEMQVSEAYESDLNHHYGKF